MTKKLDMYRYFKGEETNPFDQEKQNTQYQFWGYEQLFETKFNEGNFSESTWIPPNSEDSKEWEQVLAGKPIDKTELFKLWLFNLIMVHLPEKYQSDKDKFLRLYYDTEV